MGVAGPQDPLSRENEVANTPNQSRVDHGARPRPLSWVIVERDRDEAKQRVQKRKRGEKRGAAAGGDAIMGKAVDRLQTQAPSRPHATDERDTTCDRK